MASYFNKPRWNHLKVFLVSIFFKSFKSLFGIVKQISSPKKKRWIDEFCLIRLILEWSKIGFCINAIPLTVSRMLLSEATCVIVLFPSLIIASLLWIWNFVYEKRFHYALDRFVGHYSIRRNILKIKIEFNAFWWYTQNDLQCLNKIISVRYLKFFTNIFFWYFSELIIFLQHFHILPTYSEVKI